MAAAATRAERRDAARRGAARRGIVISYCVGELKPFELQWLVYPPQVARHFSPALAALVGYAQHRPNLGNVEGQCSSILLGDQVPDRVPAIDALRPDQAEAAEHDSVVAFGQKRALIVWQRIIMPDGSSPRIDNVPATDPSGWRRAGTPRAAIEKLAEADAFHCIAENRRQGLRKVKGLGEAPLPLFAAADKRDGGFSPEGMEPAVALRPMTEGREVVEDYRSIGLSLRGHPVRFLRPELDAMRIVKCADLQNIRDGRNVEVAGVILVRQRPGSAKGVLFVTIEDETGVAQGILWPDRFEIYRRQVMSASMIAMRGRLQKEGEVIHVICDRITDHDAMLRSIAGKDFRVMPGHGDGATHGGGPDPRDPGIPRGRTLSHPPLNAVLTEEDLVRIRSHDFH